MPAAARAKVLRGSRIVVGTKNPHACEPLSPRLPNTSGWRLWKMIYDWCGMSQDDYEAAFVRKNLEDADLWAEEGDVVVALGDEVRRAFRAQKIFIHPQIICGVEVRCIPHPSGRCLYYNDAINRDLVAMMMEDLTR